MKAKLLLAVFAALIFTSLSVGAATVDNESHPKEKSAQRVTSEDDDLPKGNNALRKFGRGVANFLFGIVEVPNQITKARADQGGGSGTTYGVGKGIMRWFQREGVGIYEIVTFPFPAPKGYKPIMKPEWPNEDYEP